MYVTEVVCENFQLLESKNASNQRQQQTGGFDNNAGGFNDFSQNNQNTQSSFGQSSSNDMPNFDRDNSNPFGNSSSIDISDDDLPF